MRPSIGKIVHYVSYGTPAGEYTSQCRAAIVTDTHARPGAVSLAVLNPEGMFFNKNVQQDDLHHVGGSWHWPERVEETS